ncbi:MAG: iron uptake porin [Cyanobacteria bacterium P01_C01_bin.89]
MTNVKGQFKPWRSPRWLLTINGLMAWGWLGVGGPAIAQPDGATMPDAIRMSDTVTYSVRPSDNGAHATAVAPAVLEPVSSGSVVADIAIGGSASGGSASGGSASGGSGANHPVADDDVPVLAQLDGPVTSVSDLTDVDPTHWAFSALRSLVERYGCISGYGDRTFRGDQSLSRYEFAAALNACLDQIGAQIEAAVQDGVDNGDLATVRRLQQEFQQELADLDRQVGDLEQRVETLENQQFSTTAVLGGEVIFGLTGAAAGDTPGDGDREVTFSHLTRMQIVSSFTGRDRLRLQWSMGNGQGLSGSNSLGTDMARLSFQGNSDNEMRLDLLDYRFAAFGDRVVFTVRPVGFDLSSVLTANSGFFDSGRGSISRFGEASPVFKLGALDVGGGFDWLVSDTVRFQAAYGVGDGDDPEFGILGGDRSAAGAQILVKPTPTILAGLAYINGYSDTGRLDTFTGSLNADLSGDRLEPAQIHAVSGTVQWRVSPRLTLGAWGAWFWTNYLENDARATTNTYLFSAAFSDPFNREGDLLAFLIGQPPRLYDGDGVDTDDDVGLHIEAFYRFSVNDNISITPGVFVLTAPEHDSDNDAIVVGTLRTTFRF